MMQQDQIFSLELLKNLVKLLKKNKAVIPTVNTKDSIKYKVKKTDI